MLLSARGEYAIRCALYVASPERGPYVGIREVSEALGIPRPFLAKLVQTLTRAGILRSLRGRTGGIALARAATAITLKEVVVAVDGSALFTACVLRLPGCGDLRPCPLHTAWVPVRERIEQMFGDATLEAVARETRANDFRLESFLREEGSSEIR